MEHTQMQVRATSKQRPAASLGSSLSARGAPQWHRARDLTGPPKGSEEVRKQ